LSFVATVPGRLTGELFRIAQLCANRKLIEVRSILDGMQRHPEGSGDVFHAHRTAAFLLMLFCTTWLVCLSGSLLSSATSRSVFEELHEVQILA
jgi:hypothetical protein